LPISVGVIGCGTIAQISHIPNLISDDDRFKLLALSDMNAELLADVADHYHISDRYLDYRELLDREDVEAVVVCHSGSHRDTVLAALESNKDVFVEKPLAWNLREAQDIARAARESDRIVQVGYHKLYDPAFPVVKRYVDEMEDLGFARITVLHPTNELGLSPHRILRGGGKVLEGHVEPGSWDHQLQIQREGLTGGGLSRLVDEALGGRKDDLSLRQCYGNVVISLIHNIYMMFGFLGPPRRLRNADYWREGMSIHLLVEYSDDLCCTLDWHYLSHLKDYREEYSFYGNRQRVSLQFPSPYFLHFPSPVTIQGGEGELAWEKRIVVSYDEAFRRELRAFHENVTNRHPPLTGVLEALEHMSFVQEIIDAIGHIRR
jgi:predicted dehydrogenase